MNGECTERWSAHVHTMMTQPSSAATRGGLHVRLMSSCSTKELADGRAQARLAACVCGHWLAVRCYCCKRLRTRNEVDSEEAHRGWGSEYKDAVGPHSLW